MKKKIVFFLSIILLIMCLVLTGCAKKEIPFGEKHNLEIANKDDTFEVPIYYYTTDKDGNIITIDGLEFEPHKMVCKYRDWNISEPDENGNVTISYTCDMDINLEYRTPITNFQWYYTFFFNSSIPFDYYTGELYSRSTVNEKGDTVFFDSNTGKDEYAYTDIVWNGKTVKIGVLNKSYNNGWGQQEYLGEENGKYHYKNTTSQSITTYITMPKDYDGVLVALNKDGSTKELFEEKNDKYNRKQELIKQADETGEKSEELIKIEQDEERVKKLVDPNDESRKDLKAEDYYIFKTADIFNIQKVEENNNNYIIYIVIGAAVVLLLCIIIPIIVIKGKKKGDNK